ncbi:MAG: VanW family protein [Chloroflexi bacterium]|nr:VanW family protein [Chloroflexota bacterium]MCC6894411.1 VanW family protein [Anaerolineae bacterium]
MTGYPSNDYYLPQERESSLNPWLVRLPILFITGTVLLVTALVALLMAFQLQYSNKALPGLSAYNVNLGGLTREQARTALTNAFTYDKQAVFTFRYNDRFWQATAGELGITFDVERTLDQVFSAGRSGSPLSDLGTQASIWLNGRSIAPIVRYDEQVAVQKLNTIASEFNRPPVDATLNMSGTVVVTTPAQTGLALDVSSTISTLENLMRQLQTGGEIPLVVSEAQPRVTDASVAADKINTALASSLTLVTDDQKGGSLGPWTANVDQIKSLLVLGLVDNPDGTLRYDVTVNTEPLRGFLESLAPGLISQPKDGRFHFNESTRQLEMIKESVNGRSLDVDTTMQRVAETVFNTTNRLVPLAFAYDLPKYSSNVTATELGITTLVGDSTTYYTGSTQSRVQNIIEGAERLNGLIIAPGETFSFNNYLGDINPEDGFVQGKIIFGGRTIDGVGGGICQVSTTAFRAALKAGFPIVERNSHGYRVGFYELNGTPPGLDAAIFQPTADFRFLNDTDYHLLMETSVFPADQSIQFRFYSTNPGRQVVMEGPVIKSVVPALQTIYQPNAELQLGQEQYIDWSKDGADVTFTRKILDMQGNEIRTDTIYTHYLPWAAVIQVAPTDPRVSQPSTG